MGGHQAGFVQMYLDRGRSNCLISITIPLDHSLLKRMTQKRQEEKEQFSGMK